MYSDPPTAPNLSSHQIWTVAPHGQRVHSSCTASSFCKVIGSCQVQLWEGGGRKRREKKGREEKRKKEKEEKGREREERRRLSSSREREGG